MTSTTKVAPKLAGKALYFELVPNPALSEDEKRAACGWDSGSATRQVILFPEWQDDTGTIHSAVAYSRSVSEYSPRAQWETRKVSSDKPKPLAEQDEESAYRGYKYLKEYSREEWDLLSKEQKRASKNLALSLELKSAIFSSISNGEETKSVQAWVVRDDKPIVVETTTQDLEEIEAWKTPQAVVRRINKVRDSIASYPKKLPAKH